MRGGRASGEERNDRLEAEDVGRGGAIFEGGEVDIPLVNHHQDVLVSVVRSDGETTRQIGGRPLRLGDGERTAGEVGFKNRGRAGGCIVCRGEGVPSALYRGDQVPTPICRNSL